MRGPRSTVVAVVVAAVALLVAGSTVWALGDDQTRPMNVRVHDVADGLRCPTCNAVSVADSNSPIARSMRVQIEEQLRAGRSPDQIRSWFVDRYGEEVLLMPRTHGLGVLLWALPVGALVVGVVVVGIRRRGVRLAPPTGEGSSRSALSARRVAVAATAFVVVGAAVPAALWDGPSEGATAAATGDQAQMDARDWVRVAMSLEEQEAYGAATDAYRKALERRPDDASVRTRLAFVLLRDGNAAEALRVVQPATSSRGATRTEALLVLGLAQRAASMPAAEKTLRTFLSTAPGHPAAAQVRRLLEEGR